MKTYSETYWSKDLIDEWFVLWFKLWKLGCKWEWKAGDCLSYPCDRRVFRLASTLALIGDSGQGFPIPLPSWGVIQYMGEDIFVKDEGLYWDLENFSQKIAPGSYDG